MYEWFRVIFAKKSKFHDAGGPDTVVSPLLVIPHLENINILLYLKPRVNGSCLKRPYFLVFNIRDK